MSVKRRRTEPSYGNGTGKYQALYNFMKETLKKPMSFNFCYDERTRIAWKLFSIFDDHYQGIGIDLDDFEKAFETARPPSVVYEWVLCGEKTNGNNMMNAMMRFYDQMHFRNKTRLQIRTLFMSIGINYHDAEELCDKYFEQVRNVQEPTQAYYNGNGKYQKMSEVIFETQDDFFDTIQTIFDHVHRFYHSYFNSVTTIPTYTGFQYFNGRESFFEIVNSISAISILFTKKFPNDEDYENAMDAAIELYDGERFKQKNELMMRQVLRQKGLSNLPAAELAKMQTFH